ncbi:NADP-dependent oxidoreductase [Mucilaginibacter sp. JRF]|uniref:NADP-dependent oxidoreductase n=1 Tax=Mucilaginibacter sp. JRF TaxID=2780088 RepID=UPI00188139E8|nr:NADP-dependent oxidoreductase [Mucilaginibacter sp. JRF]MBE9584674.1 NADP-dependent oxidoreductase [Mucilaginibacter sp. JRF]
MKAIVLNKPGEVSELQIQEIAIPTIQADEVLIKVKAISINPVDAKTRVGKGVYGRIKNEQPLIIGWDVSGTVTETRSDRFKVGDEVFGMVNFPGHGKGYAEFVAAPASHLALKPVNISHQEAAAATLAALTALQALVHNANVQPGQKVLVHAAAGGVGHFAVQIAKQLGAIVTGTSSAKNKELVLQFGADAHIDYHNYDWKNHPEEFDFVLDTIGGSNIDLSIAVTKKGGTVISIPTGLSDEVTEKAKAKGVNGYFILVQSNGDDMQQIAEWLEKGIVKAHVSQTFKFDDIAAAHTQIESGRTTGKIVVTV